MRIEILSYHGKIFKVKDLTTDMEFKIPAKTLIGMLKLHPDVLCPALVHRRYTITTTAVEN